MKEQVERPDVFPPGAIEDIERELSPSSPRGESGRRGVQTAEAGPGARGESPPLPKHPDWWPRDLESEFAQKLEEGYAAGDARDEAENEYADKVIRGLMTGDIAGDAEAVGTARRLLQEKIGGARWARDRFAVSAFGEVELADRIPWLPDFLQSAEQRALDAAVNRQKLLGYAEGIAKLRQEARSGVPSADSSLTPKQAELQKLVENYNVLSKQLFDAKNNAPFPGQRITRLSLPEYLEPQWVGEIKAMEKALSNMEGRMSILARESGVGLTYSKTLGEPWQASVGPTGMGDTGARVSSSPIYTAETPSAGAEFSSFPAETIPPDAILGSAPPSRPAPPTPQPATPPLPVQKPQPLAPAAPPTSASPPPSSGPSAPPSAPAPSSSGGPGGSSSGGGSSGGGFVQGGLNFLSALWQGLLSLFGGGSDRGAGSSSSPQPPQRPPPQPSTPPSAAITANPSLLDAGESTQLSWSSVGSPKCAIVDALLNVIASGTSGTASSPTLYGSSRFGIICDIAGGNDKFVNETLVRVDGDTSDPPLLFSQSGPVSQAAPVGTNSGTSGGTSVGASGDSGGTASGDASSSLSQPIDVRTCDPEQPIDSFIRCLCEAEPNPAGCTIPPGGI